MRKFELIFLYKWKLEVIICIKKLFHYTFYSQKKVISGLKIPESCKLFVIE